MEAVEKSYAAALLALAEDPAEAERFGEVLDAYAAAYAGSAPLRSFLLNPVLPRGAQKDALARLAPPNAPQKALNCLYLMVDKGRIALLPAVAAAYHSQRAAANDTLIIHVRTAAPLDKGQEEKLCAHFAALHGAAKAVVETVLDPGLIGGIRVQVGDVLYDQSLFGRLEGLRRAVGEQLAKTKN